MGLKKCLGVVIMVNRIGLGIRERCFGRCLGKRGIEMRRDKGRCREGGIVGERGELRYGWCVR